MLPLDKRALVGEPDLRLDVERALVLDPDAGVTHARRKLLLAAALGAGVGGGGEGGEEGAQASFGSDGGFARGFVSGFAGHRGSITVFGGGDCSGRGEFGLVAEAGS